MEFRHLRYFVAVAEEGHVTRAAERVGIQQPPLSQQIRALETELGVQLFRRRPRGMELTEAGRVLLDDARAILAHVDHALLAARRTARGEQGRIVVGLTSSAPFQPFVPRVIRAFRESHPLVSLVLEESGTGELVDALRTDQVDIAFIRSPVADSSGLVVHHLLAEDFLIALPGGHPLAAGVDEAALPLEALASDTFILYRRPLGPGLYDAIIAACHGAGFSPRVSQEVPRILSTLSLVAAGLGVSLIPASLRRLHIDGVAYRRVAGSPQFKARLNLAHRRGETSPAVQRLIDLARRTARKSAAGAAHDVVAER